MKSIVRWMVQFLNKPIATPEVKKTRAYLEGFDAWGRRDGRNPYEPGTPAHLHWKLGFQDGEHCWATTW